MIHSYERANDNWLIGSVEKLRACVCILIFLLSGTYLIWDNYALNIGSSRMVYSVLFWAYRPTCLGPYWRSRNRRNFGLYYRLWVSDPKKRKNGLFDGFSVDKLRRTKMSLYLLFFWCFWIAIEPDEAPMACIYLSIRLKMLKPIAVEISLVGVIGVSIPQFTVRKKDSY